MVTSILWKVHAATPTALESMTREAISWNERKERIKIKVKNLLQLLFFTW